jgi:hypothetical protein
MVNGVRNRANVAALFIQLAHAVLEPDVAVDSTLVDDEQRVYAPIPPLIDSGLTLMSFNVPTINLDANAGVRALGVEPAVGFFLR